MDEHETEQRLREDLRVIKELAVSAARRWESDTWTDRALIAVLWTIRDRAAKALEG